MNPSIILTGGGTAGHAIPNIALIPELQSRGWEIHYIGTQAGIEKTLLERCGGAVYHAVSSGKLRRYFSLKNLMDPLRVIRGIFQAAGIIRRVKPNVIFSKGGFAGVPAVVGGRLLGVPVILHESDYTPGLANRLSAPFAGKVCVSFEDTLRHIRRGKGVFTGTPVRRELFLGQRRRGLDFCGLPGKKPVLLIMGGSMGAASLNAGVRAALPELLARYEIIHLCGKGKDEGLAAEHYRSYEYVGDELPDLLAAADLVLSRAGAGALFELLALRKPMLLVPLPLAASRGDQLQNARYAAARGYALILEQEALTADTLLAGLDELYARRAELTEAMETAPPPNGAEAVMQVITETARNR